MKRRITKIKIQGMHNTQFVTYALDKVNYFYGHNGAGKSTALEAMQLALLGYIPGKGKTNGAIVRHANGNIMAIELTISGDDTIQISRSWTTTAKGTTSALNVVRNGATLDPNSTEILLTELIGNLELPIFNFNEFANLTANKLKDWFVDFMPSTNHEVNWSEVLPNAVINTPYYRPEILENIWADAPKGSTIEGVREMNAFLKQCLPSQKQTLTRLTETSRSLVYFDECAGDNPDMLAAQIQVLRSERDQVKKWRDVHAQNEYAYAELQKYSDLAKSLADDPKYEESAVIRTQSASEMLELSSQLDEYQAQKSKILNDMAIIEHLIDSAGICPYSNSACNIIVEKIESEYRLKHSELVDELRKVKAKVEQLSELQKAAQLRHNDASQSISTLSMRYAQRDQLRSRIRKEPEIDPTWKDKDYDVLIDDLQDRQIKAASNASYAELSKKLVSQKFETEMTIECLKIWIKLTDVNGLQNDMMNMPFTRLADQVDQYLKYTMGQDTRAKFDLSNRSNSFSFGVLRNDEYIPFDLLSSGEKCMFALALLMTICNVSDASLKTIIIDDMFDHLDDNNLKNVVSALKQCSDIQFIVAGVKLIEDPEVNVIKL